MALSAAGDPGGQRRRLQSGAVARGKVMEVEGTTAVVNVGMPAVVELAAEPLDLEPGRMIEFAVAETPKGFFVI
jgi:ribosomal protein S1